MNSVTFGVLRASRAQLASLRGGISMHRALATGGRHRSVLAAAAAAEKAKLDKAAADLAHHNRDLNGIDEDSLFNRLAEDRWSGRIRLFTRIAMLCTLVYAVAFMDYTPYTGDAEHVFSPIQRWVKRQRAAFWTLSDAEVVALKTKED